MFSTNCMFDAPIRSFCSNGPILCHDPDAPAGHAGIATAVSKLTKGLSLCQLSRLVLGEKRLQAVHSLVNLLVGDAEGRQEAQDGVADVVKDEPL